MAVLKAVAVRVAEGPRGVEVEQLGAQTVQVSMVVVTWAMVGEGRAVAPKVAGRGGRRWWGGWRW